MHTWWSSAKRGQRLRWVSSKKKNLATKLTLQTETKNLFKIWSRMPDASLQGPCVNEKKSCVYAAKQAD